MSYELLGEFLNLKIYNILEIRSSLLQVCDVFRWLSVYCGVSDACGARTCVHDYLEELIGFFFVFQPIPH